MGRGSGDKFTFYLIFYSYMWGHMGLSFSTSLLNQDGFYFVGHDDPSQCERCLLWS